MMGADHRVVQDVGPTVLAGNPGFYYLANQTFAPLSKANPKCSRA